MLSGSDMNTGADVKGGLTTLRKGQGRGDAAPSKGGETTKRRVRTAGLGSHKDRADVKG